MTDREAMKLVKILENIEDYRITMTAAHEIRRLHFENKELKERLAQPEQEPVALDLSQVNRLTHFKTNGIIDAHKYNITGFVLTNGDGKKCISDMAAVRWFDNKDFFGMMHNEPAYPPQRTEQEPLIGCVNHDCDKCKLLKDERLELIGHADLAINNIYIFNGYGEDVPEDRTPIYAGYKAAHGIKETT
jgi:hypothetical protein